MRKPRSSAAADLDSQNAPQTERISLGRVKTLGVVLVLPFAVLVARLWYLQIARGPDYLQQAESNRTRVLRVEAPRGLILDAHGSLLASNKPQFAVYAVPAIAQQKTVLDRLAGILRIAPSDLAQTLRAERRNSFSPVRVALNLPISVISQVEEQRPFMPGVSTAPEPVRWYPNNDLLANTLGTLGRIDPAAYRTRRAMGYFSDDFVGKGGLEGQYENLLHGTPGGMLVEVKARGAAVNLGQVEPIPGKTLHLTIDSTLQQAAEDTYRAYGWTGGAVALNPSTGAVLAMASAPTYNPNAFAKGIDQRSWATLLMNPDKPMINRAVDSLYPPGSTFKQVVALAGLQTRAITPQTSWYCSGSLEVDKKRFGCWAVHGETDLYKAIAQSCDVYFYRTGQLIGPDRLSGIAREYALARLSGIDLPHEMIGSIPSPAWKKKRFGKFGALAAQWYDGDTLNMSIGQGYVLTTPLQMAMVTAATATSGTVYRPYLLDYAQDPLTGVVVSKTKPTVLSRVAADASNFAVVQEGMRECVTRGTGRVVDFDGLDVAAKTGSAEVTNSNVADGWFVAYAPYEHPRVAIAAVVEHGGHGGDSAGKVVRAMLKAYFKLSKEDMGKTAASD